MIKSIFFLFDLNGNQEFDRGLDNEVQYTCVTYFSSAILEPMKTPWMHKRITAV